MKEKAFAFRVSENDLTQIKNKARQAGKTATDYLVLSALNKKITVIEGLPEVASELKAIGRNLNQLTTLANMGRVSVVNLREFTEQFTAICTIFERLTRGIR